MSWQEELTVFSSASACVQLEWLLLCVGLLFPPCGLAVFTVVDMVLLIVTKNILLLGAAKHDSK